MIQILDEKKRNALLTQICGRLPTVFRYKSKVGLIIFFVLQVIVKDMRPLSLVEGEAFIDMIEYACPGFKCPSR